MHDGSLPNQVGEEYMCGYEGVIGNLANLFAIFGLISFGALVYEGMHRLFFRRK